MGGLGTFQRQVAQDPAKVMTWLGVMRDEVKTDLPFPELLRLALLATKVPASASGTSRSPAPAAPAAPRWSISSRGRTRCSPASAPAS